MQVLIIHPLSDLYLYSTQAMLEEGEQVGQVLELVEDHTVGVCMTAGQSLKEKNKLHLKISDISDTTHASR